MWSSTPTERARPVGVTSGEHGDDTRGLRFRIDHFVQSSHASSPLVVRYRHQRAVGTYGYPITELAHRFGLTLGDQSSETTAEAHGTEGRVQIRERRKRVDDLQRRGEPESGVGHRARHPGGASAFLHHRRISAA